MDTQQIMSTNLGYFVAFIYTTHKPKHNNRYALTGRFNHMRPINKLLNHRGHNLKLNIAKKRGNSADIFSKRENSMHSIYSRKEKLTHIRPRRRLRGKYVSHGGTSYLSCFAEGVGMP